LYNIVFVLKICFAEKKANFAQDYLWYAGDVIVVSVSVAIDFSQTT